MELTTVLLNDLDSVEKLERVAVEVALANVGSWLS